MLFLTIDLPPLLYSRMLSAYLLILFFLNAQSQVEVVFDEGNALYNQGNYTEAIEKYNSIINNGFESGELYYNLGNAYYKINDIANSIFYFEKSLLLDPNNNEIVYGGSYLGFLERRNHEKNTSYVITSS